MKSNYRYDIQALRGLAVLMVVFHHAGFMIPAGYMGVDIFFVISGFLMTTLIAQGLNDNTFTFRGFYARRIRRLLPAAYVVLLFTTVGGFFLLTQSEFNDLKTHVLGSVTFTTNIFLWKQTNYFTNAAELKPLLHMWSLAVEEQFYLFIPLALFLTPRKLWLPLGTLTVAISLAVCLYFVKDRPTPVFFLLPTRAWELGIGCLAALIVSYERFMPLWRALFWPALASIIILPFIWISDSHPGIGAAVVCFAAAIIILARSQFVEGFVGAKILAHVGDVSYSLYLIHWPLFAFANNMYLGASVPLGVRIGIVIVSFALSYPLFKVEERYRYKTGASLKKMMVVLLAISIFLVSLPYALGFLKTPDYAHLLRPNFGYDDSCVLTDDIKVSRYCEKGDTPEILLWGDSYAMHLGAGIGEKVDSFVQKAISGCGPFIHLSHVTYPNVPPPWARECIRANNDALDYLASHSSIKIVIISSSLNAYTDPLQKGILVDKDGERYINLGVEPSVKYFGETVQAIRKLGKKVILISPTAHGDYNIAACMERKFSGLTTLGPNRDCAIHKDTAEQVYPHVYDFLRQVEKKFDVPVIYLSDYFCEGDECKAEWDGTIMYRDSAHLSRDGSKLLFQKTDIMDQIYKRAR